MPSGINGIKFTLKEMRRLVDAGKENPVIRQAALYLVRDLRQKDYNSEIERLFNYVKNNIRYVRDIHGVELLHTPENLLKIKQGDCDDKSVLIASLLESIGHKTRFKVIGQKQNSFSHVYVEVFNKGKWIALETTEDFRLGEAYRDIKSTAIYDERGFKMQNGNFNMTMGEGEITGQSLLNTFGTLAKSGIELFAIKQQSNMAKKIAAANQAQTPTVIYQQSRQEETSSNMPLIIGASIAGIALLLFLTKGRK